MNWEISIKGTRKTFAKEAEAKTKEYVELRTTELPDHESFQKMGTELEKHLAAAIKSAQVLVEEWPNSKEVQVDLSGIVYPNKYRSNLGQTPSVTMSVHEVG